MVEAGSMPALEILARASRVIAEGEVLQLTRAHDLDLPQETYLEIIDAKTAELFAAASEAGAVSAGAESTGEAVGDTADGWMPIETRLGAGTASAGESFL